MSTEIDLNMLYPVSQEVFKSLQRKRTEKNISISEKIELATLFIELEKEESAFELYEEIIESDPENIQAKMWYAHFILHYREWSKELVEKGLFWANELIKIGGETAAFGFQIKAHALSIRKDPDSKEEIIKCLRESIRLSPDWSFNHKYLGSLLEEQGALSEACLQYEMALKNRLEGFDKNWGPTERYFESVVTGRVRHESEKRVLAELIKDLRLDLI